MKAIEKVGIAFPSKKDAQQIFAHYDLDRSGALDYKEFTGMVIQDKTNPMAKTATYGGGYGAKAPPKEAGNAGELFQKLKAKLATRGARGMIGLGKQFRIFDDNNSRSLDNDEFKKAMTEQMLGFSQTDIQTLFNYFDRSGDGSVDYDEFIRTIRGPMNNFRKRLVAQAFKKIDKDGSGFVDVNDIKGTYNASRHPDVIQGKKTEDEILMEFLETFETHHNIANSSAPDHIVTLEEFEEYYNNVSASVDNDQYFELMINNAWKMNEGDKSYSKGWSNAEDKPKGKSLQSSA